MVQDDKKLDVLCSLYEGLNDKGKGTVIKLGEGLLNSQEVIDAEITNLNEERPVKTD